MSNTTLPPIRGLGLPGLSNVEVPDLVVEAWAEPVRRAWLRSDEIVNQRHNFWGVRRYEYQQFYSAWVGLAFRFRACSDHNRIFAASFIENMGDVTDEQIYIEDEALFGFFVKGLSALDCLSYGLYALGALILLPTDKPSEPPSKEFPLLDPSNPKKLKTITWDSTLKKFEGVFSSQPITHRLRNITENNTFKSLKDIRNVLAHRTASAGRSLDYSSSSAPFPWPRHPSTTTSWGGDIALSLETTAIPYQWLRETLNETLKEVAAFVAQELAYDETVLPKLAP